MSDRVDCIVIGAGVVGLAVARELTLAGREVIVLEGEDAIGTQTSSRNSEVIHAGIYYPPGSVRARLCVEGKHAMYAYCAEHGVPHQRIGKLVVATTGAEVPTLHKYVELSRANGVHDLEWVEPARARELEPAVECVAALLSPSTGIVDSHAFMQALLGDAEAHGAMLARCSPVEGGRIDQDGITLEVGGGEPMTIVADHVVNSAGLGAQALARGLAGFPAEQVPPLFYAKAHYFTLSGRSPFNRLVYPIAREAFLGVHVTLDLGGQARFGPDLEWVDHVDYDFDQSRAALFYPAIRQYYPGLRDGALQPGYTGMRPKLSGRGAAAADFMIQTEAQHGVAGLVNLFGIESPGLTASLAIARVVREALGIAAGT